MSVNVKQIVLDLEAAIDAVGLWLDMPDDKLLENGARAKRGVGHGWTIVIIEWDGGVDGAATRLSDGLVTRMTPELAQRAKEKAWPAQSPS